MEDPIVKTNISAMKNLRVIFDTSPYAMLISTDEGFVEANEVAFQIFHAKNRGDLIGKTSDIVSPPVKDDGSPSDKGSLSHIQRAISGEIVIASLMIMKMVEKLWHKIRDFTV